MLMENTIKDNDTIVKTETNEKHGAKALVTGTILAICFGIAGCAFGTYGMIKASSTPTPSGDGDCSNNTSTATDKTDSSNNSNDNTNSEINYNFTSESFDGKIEYQVSYGPDETETKKVATTVTSPNNSYGKTYVLNGDGTLLSYEQREPMGGTPKNLTNLLPGTPVDITVGQLGNGGDSWLIILLSDGRVATMSELNNEDVSIVENANNIKRVYGNYTDSLSALGYVQGKDGKMHKIKIADKESTKWSFAI